MARLFFAIWPDGAVREALAAEARRLAEALEGRPVPPEKIHLTLAFLGEAGARADDASVLAAGIPGSRFAMRIDHVGAFRKARVAWAGMERAPAALAMLQAAIEAASRDAGFALEDRPFTPHVTLVRRISRGFRRAPIAPIEWRAEAFVLVRSDTATGRYDVVAEWKLGI